MMVIVFGSINLDLSFSLPKIPAVGETVLGPTVRVEPGGKGANQAVGAARDGAMVVMAGAIGNDPLGAGALALLRQAGVDLTRVPQVGTSTGCAAIAVDPAGHNAIAVGSGANMQVTAGQIEDALLGPEATLVLQMEVPAEETAALIARARARGARIILNLAPATPLPDAALRAVDVLIVNESEGAWLAGDLGCAASAESLRARLDIPAVVLTRGAEGAEVASLDRSWLEPARKVVAVDTTAAGDCFVGVLAGQLDLGHNLEASVRRASAAAALCCTRAGSQGSIPLQAETNRFIETG
jgi:ribokinase